MSTSFVRILVGVMVAGVLANAASALNMETVSVGNAGNAADSRYASPGYGSVGYTYNIGKYEVTAGQYTAFLNAVAKTDTYGLYNTNMLNDYGCKIQRNGTSGNYEYYVASDYANRPVNYVNWGDAARFANWMHNDQPMGTQGLNTTEDGAYYLNGATSDADLLVVTRKSNAKWAIPTEDEWYKTAYHKNDGVTDNYWDYTTSSDMVPYRDMTDVSGNNANYDTNSGTIPIDPPYYTTVVGEFQDSDSPYGTFDQGGNVFEWNEAVIGSGRGLRGGCFNNVYNTLLASYRYYNYSPPSDLYGIGFRVVEVPEPGTMTLLTLGGLVALRRKRF